MGSNVVWWHRRHSVSRLQRIGDWIGMGKNAPLPTPLEPGNEPLMGPPDRGDVRVGGGSSGEPVGHPVSQWAAGRALRVELERANGAVVELRRPGRPRKARG